MDSLYNLAVRLELSAGGMMQVAEAAMQSFMGLESGAGRAQRAMASLQERMRFQESAGLQNTAAYRANLQNLGATADQATLAQERLNTSTQSAGMLVAGIALTGLGMAGVGAMKQWVSGAMEVQTALVSIGLATHATQAQLDGLRTLSFDVSSKTRFSSSEILSMANLGATGGINDPRVLTSMLPTLAKLAEIEYQSKGVAYAESVPAAVSIAHQFQAFGALPGMSPAQATKANTQFQALMGRVAQAATVSNLTPSQLEHSLAYLTSAHAGLGLSPEQAIELVSFSSNVGLTGGQGGGARLRAFYQRMAGPGKGKHNLWSNALNAIEHRGGGRFFDAQGQFENTDHAFAILARASATYGKDQQKRIQDFHNAFGSAGEMIATVGSTPEAQKRQRQLMQSFAADPIAFTNQAQERYNNTLSGQLANLQTNMQNLGNILGNYLIPPLTAVTHMLVDLSSGLVTFAGQHPLLTQVVADTALVGTAIALIGGPILAAVGAFGLLTIGLNAVTGSAAGAAAATGAQAAANGLGAGVGGAGLFAGLAGKAGAVGGLLGLGSLGSLFGGAGAGVSGALGGMFGFASIGEAMAAIGGLSGAIELAGAALLGLVASPVVLIGAAATAAVLVFTHWDQVVRALGITTHWLGDQFSSAGKDMHTFLDIGRKIPGFAGITDKVGQTIHDIAGSGRKQNLPQLPDGGAGGFLVPNTRGTVDLAGPALANIYAAAAKASGVPLSLLLAQGAREGDFRNVAQKGGGGLGLAQWDFSTGANATNAMKYLHASSVAQAKLYAMDPSRAIPAQAAYDRALYGFHGSWTGALRDYNGSGHDAERYALQVSAAAQGVRPAHPTAQAHPPARGGHQIIVNAPISIHPAPGEHPQATTKKVAQHIKSTLHAELDGAIRNAQGHGGLDLNGHYV